MDLHTIEDISRLVAADPWRMRVLVAVRDLGLPDCWVGAGFVRNLVWDELHGYKDRTPLADVDVVYFDPSDVREEAEVTIAARLREQIPDVPWEVVNQARAHRFHGHAPYRSTTEALSHWVETATCIGVRLTTKNEVEVTAPHGISDLVSGLLRPVPDRDLTTFETRIRRKGWRDRWPKLRIVTA